MSFFQLVRREMQGSLTRLAVMSGLGGVSNAAILAAINAGAQSAAGVERCFRTGRDGVVHPVAGTAFAYALKFDALQLKGFSDQRVQASRRT